MKDVEQALNAWKQYAQLHDIDALRIAIRENKSGSAPEYVNELRSVCWKALLLFEDEHQPEKLFDAACLPILSNSRAAYASLRTHYLKAIENPSYIDTTGTDPLSEDEQSLWNSLRADEIVREEIWRDVERCMPDNDYFRDPRIQKYLLDVLFIWCKLNPDVGYRQGMHEILAPLIWVVDADAVDAGSIPLDATLKENDALAALCDVLDAQFVEHDAFSLFARIMQTAKSFYEPAQKNADDGDAPMIVRARNIFDELLPLVDPELARHLHHIDVLPQIFLMRWVRLLFGREFAFNDVLQMWDLIFAAGSQLELVNYVCLTMLLRIRWQLLQSDMNSALTLLLRYPALDGKLPARDLVLDARRLLQATNTDTGSSLVSKYSGRPPAAFDAAQRPSTPVLGTPPRIRTPLATASSPASLETLLQDAAKGVMSTSERWGLNQAVRDVVGEVKRGVERNLPIRDSAAWSRSSSPLGGFHARSRSTKASTETHSMIAANAFRKLNTLEERNRKLAQTLHKAVDDLWAFHEELVNKAKAAGKLSNEDGQFAERLSRSVAEVQFVQAFLQDVTLPLPNLPIQGPLAQTQAKSSMQPQPGTGADPQPHSDALKAKHDPNNQVVQFSIAASATASIPDATVPPSPSQSTETSSMVPPTSHKDSTSPQSTNDKKSLSPASAKPSQAKAALMDPFLARPRLTSTSFSWMLADNNIDSQQQPNEQHQHQHQQQPFSRATPFAPNEKRSRARTGKGFLFGDEDDPPDLIDVDDGSKKRRGSSQKRDGSSSAAGRKGSKSSKASKKASASGGGAIVMEREDIGLGDYGS